MSWACGPCAFNQNPYDAKECTNCGVTSEEAEKIVVKVRRKTCFECGHRHKFGIYCHVYCANDGGGDDDEDGEDENDDDDNEDEEDEDDEHDDDEDDDVIGRKKKVEEVKEYVPKKQEAAKDPNKKYPLPTPDNIKGIGYIRCNCLMGVPDGNRFFDPMPMRFHVGEIIVQQYDDIVNASSAKKATDLTVIGDEVEEEKKRLKLQGEVGILLPLVLRYLQIGACSLPAVCSKAWSYGCNLFSDYRDVRDMVPWQVIKVHKGQVDAVVVHGNKVYSGGDRRIIATDYIKGEVLCCVTRDSGDIPYLTIKDGDLYAGSVNGSIRTFGLMHNPKQIKLSRTVWGHSKTVMKVEFAKPSEGVCQMHGISNHVCSFYSVSEDRSLKVYNMSTFQQVASVEPKTIRNASMNSIAQSARHLFAGTSAATVLVFSKTNNCEREDVHACNQPGAYKIHCLQVTLMLPPLRMPSLLPIAVTKLLVTGPFYQMTHLWAADSSGQLTVWQVPQSGIDFKPVKTWKAHNGCITDMVNTWKHCITISDDGNLLLTDLASLRRVRTLNIQEWALNRGLIVVPEIKRTLKCLCVREDFEKGGTIVIGTSYGEIVICSIGTCV